ncbi:hydantoinase/oxoprolinase family protein [Cellulomonas iranensis]|uniref:hydantoinase/oxoprolinase family protein n=1 Tax=Cellulomonas iranensis TaxID=76862 RepID=UPI001CF10E19|nr:hydantoinase/oxoprolinase family protein [Cellulomonas iranensis]UCN14865.1 hydantoinase/oxoprolinase family protein [Cellulomonas iranensis]
MTAAPRWRVGVDVGGTFTDLVAVPTHRTGHDLSRLVAHKVASTPHDPAAAVEEGLRGLAERGVAFADVASVTHGTTIGLNAILQRRGARVAVLTSRGHRDLVQIGRARLPRSFDLHATPPAPLVPRDRVVEVDLRFGADGAPVATLDEPAYAAARDALAATTAAAVAVCLVGGYAAPAAEAALAARLTADLGVPVTSAGALWPESGEYERTVLAVLDAQVRPLMTAYLTSLRDRVAQLGLTAPLFISTSNGGSVSLAAALERPVTTVLSGPAAGVSAAGLLWPDRDVVTLDMGGTSSDIGVVRSGHPAVTTTTSIGDHPLTTPVVDVEAIGAGGGSVAWADGSGAVVALRVGPRSVGAVPGPVAYGQGGQHPALTDAYVHAGAIADGAFLQGRMRLDAAAATAALDALGAALADPGTGDATGVTDAVLRTATAGMSTRVRTVLARHGEVPDAFTFVAFGGAGGTHTALLAHELGVRRVVVPAAAATFCALGAALAPVRRDLVRSVHARADDAGTREVDAVARALAATAVDWLQEQGVGTEGELTVAVDARYDAQPTTLTVDVAHVGTPDVRAGLPPLRAEDVADLFAQAHTRYHGFADPSVPVVVEAVRVAVRGAQAPVVRTGGRDGLRTVAHRRLRVDGRWHDAAVLAPAPDGTTDAVPGPAVVEKGDTSVVVPPGWTVALDGAADLVLTRTATTQGGDHSAHGA